MSTGDQIVVVSVECLGQQPDRHEFKRLGGDEMETTTLSFEGFFCIEGREIGNVGLCLR